MESEISAEPQALRLQRLVAAAAPSRHAEGSYIAALYIVLDLYIAPLTPPKQIVTLRHIAGFFPATFTV